MKLETISKETARRFLVSRQGFHQYQGKDGTLQAIKKLECIQIDPVQVVHRNHHLVLHNRASDYELSFLDTLLYEDRAVFEYWCNEKSIIPVEEFRYFSYHMHHCMEFHSPFYERLKAKKEEFEEATRKVLSAIEAGGPRCAIDFKEDVGSKIANRVLNLLWDSGKVMIHHVEGNRRHYDLTERILPKGLDTTMPSREEYDQFMVEKYMRAYGLVDVRDWRFGWLPLKSAQRKALVRKLTNAGKLCPIKIEGVKQVYYILEKSLSTLEAAENFRVENRVYFVAPLDNLIWNRKMVSDLFDFAYAWEIYKVPEKRQYGYYVMPILYGTKFVGRLDPKLDRRNKTLIINSLLLEKDCIKEELVVELVVALRKFLYFHNASQVKILKVTPKKLKNILLVELNQPAKQCS
ncbi:MAG: winged helix-turn-helix domain-containing protein [Candidatus Bathyarchaeia archaeon]